jgi:hypothetical protein
MTSRPQERLGAAGWRGSRAGVDGAGDANRTRDLTFARLGSTPEPRARCTVCGHKGASLIIVTEDPARDQYAVFVAEHAQALRHLSCARLSHQSLGNGAPHALAREPVCRRVVDRATEVAELRLAFTGKSFSLAHYPYGGGLAIRYGYPLLIEAFCAQIVGSKPEGRPDFICASVSPVIPGSFGTLPAPWLGLLMPLVSRSQ